jgi:hypothetical protein
MKKDMFPIVVIGLLVAILGVIGYKLSPMRSQNADVTLPVSSCSPALQPCTTTLPNGRPLDFSIEPRPVKPLQPLHLKVTAEGTEAQSVDVDFNGTDMDMGHNRVSLTRDQQGFSGQAMLPVCVTGTMTWTATVLLTTRTQRIAVPFHFVVAGR